MPEPLGPRKPKTSPSADHEVDPADGLDLTVVLQSPSIGRDWLRCSHAVASAASMSLREGASRAWRARWRGEDGEAIAGSRARRRHAARSPGRRAQSRRGRCHRGHDDGGDPPCRRAFIRGPISASMSAPGRSTGAHLANVRGQRPAIRRPRPVTTGCPASRSSATTGARSGGRQRGCRVRRRGHRPRR